MQDTIYFVQGFRAADGQRSRFTALPGFACGSADQARHRVETLGATCDGVIAWCQQADLATGEYGAPVLLQRLGNVPDLR
ncbi:hypothetical protein GCM10009552_15300 [Rothia nasimurium]|uniref:Uncharacterized protein n=1 Tax=Luteibacter anthropi TaxID=564369 RepID=A0A7X5UBB8_9GAMM|nr:hypothetical protein [Luteibacter anthropi]NII07197.1 hypothetical protein [Luteibacter anthropi]